MEGTLSLTLDGNQLLAHQNIRAHELVEHQAVWWVEFAGPGVVVPTRRFAEKKQLQLHKAFLEDNYFCSQVTMTIT